MYVYMYSMFSFGSEGRKAARNRHSDAPESNQASFRQTATSTTDPGYSLEQPVQHKRLHRLKQDRSTFKGEGAYEYINFERGVARAEVKDEIDQSATEREIQVVTSELVEKEEVEFSENPAYVFEADQETAAIDDVMERGNTDDDVTATCSKNDKETKAKSG